MKKGKLKDLRSKTVKELEKVVEKMKADLLKVKVSAKVGKQRNLKEAGNLRHEIAQILTIIREKQISKKETKDMAKK